MFLICGEALFDFFVEPDQAAGHASMTFKAIAGGSPFNVAVGLSRLSRSSALMTGVSDDFLGEKLFDVLTREGVNTDYVVRLDAPTTLAMVAPGSDGSPRYAFYGERAADRSLTRAHLPVLSDEVEGIHLGSYSLVVDPTADTLLDLVAHAGEQRLISLDPNIRLAIEPSVERWQQQVSAFASYANMIKLSDEDVHLLYPEREIEDVARSFLSKRCGLVIVTQGGDGAVAYTHDHAPVSVPITPLDVVDAVGAGDTFQAALLCWLSEQRLSTPAGVSGLVPEQIRAMMAFAHRAAAVTCQRRGPDLPHRSDVADA
ncbi:carbohydrate kinase family protein [Larsenimonas rhizosphaerae]|uniref:Carbohydrate kinase n=1 Tax=Larsenimonas rhizosphaerae TaxID=2944682 RepID=A0AA42CT02_9GAMM|nr:carbohydrate kinase [Larsenimonas rhizosphaerae]MCX2522634.1 carbohydrate kinase [Larsenimonas rhizosphaerae]